MVHRNASKKASGVGVRLSLITKVNVGAFRYLLEHERLQYLEQVFGMLGQFYGECDFDGANPEPSSLEGSSDCASCASPRRISSAA